MKNQHYLLLLGIMILFHMILINLLHFLVRSLLPLKRFSLTNVDFIIKIIYVRKIRIDKKKTCYEFCNMFFLNIGFFVYTCYNKKRNNIAKERD